MSVHMFRIERVPHENEDASAQKILRQIPVFFSPWKNFKNLRARVIEIFWVRITKKESWPVLRESLATEILGELHQELSFESSLPLGGSARPGFQWWCLEKSFRPGVTDNAAQVLQEALFLVHPEEKKLKTHSGTRLWLELPKEVVQTQVAEFADQFFHNSLIEDVHVLTAHEALNKAPAPRGMMAAEQSGGVEPLAAVEAVTLAGKSVTELEALSEERLWALSGIEMCAIQEHYRQQGRTPTLVELEVLAQTWSEHCKHKIFASHIEVQNNRTDMELPAQVNSIFKTYICGATKELNSSYLRSVFEDNAGVIAVTSEWDVAIKVETHNSPSALDPYGGALTGIVGVNRDILGVGLGAHPIANLDVFCVGPLDVEPPLPPRLHHPRRILEGVRLGVEHGGNKSGIPTVTGAVVHHPGFLGKPLIFCGTVGLIPRDQKNKRDLLKKKIAAGDAIVMVGGRIGKDGIHGATFSSLELNEASPVSAVQLGDPLTQRRVWNFLLEARDQILYDAVTDNGAGGLSSSVGELARLCGHRGGAVMDVGKALTKYPGLLPHELVISESQERMTVSVPKNKLKEFISLAERRNVECSVLGTFEDSGVFEIRVHDHVVGQLDMEFLHEGVPTMNLTAQVREPRSIDQAPTPVFVVDQFWNASSSLQKLLLSVLSHPNVRSRRDIVRQYDHEVQARTVRKPYGTVNQGAPGDGATLRLSRDHHEGVAVGLGLAPHVATVDAKCAAELALDEAVRNAVVAGADPDHLALVDNFCWPDPLPGSSNPDAQEKLGDLVVTAKRLYDGALALKAPFISGKDSMKNDYRVGNVKISVPPTILVTALGRVPDVTRVSRGQVTKPGLQILWVSGQKIKPNNYGLPTVQFSKAATFFRGIHRLMMQGLIPCVHDVSEGGWLGTTAEMLLGSGWGARLQVALDREEDHAYRFSQLKQLFFEPATSFVLAVEPKAVASVKQELEGFVCVSVGEVVGESAFSCEVLKGHKIVAEATWSISDLEQAYQGGVQL